jgi:hypothetical protein
VLVDGRNLEWRQGETYLHTRLRRAADEEPKASAYASPDALELPLAKTVEGLVEASSPQQGAAQVNNHAMDCGQGNYRPPPCRRGEPRMAVARARPHR